MSPLSVHQNRQGPDWPLGFIRVATPGVPVSIMSLVDPTFANSPESATSLASAEYAPRAHEIIIAAFKPGASHGLQMNTGNLYLLRAGVLPALGNRDDYGAMLPPIGPGQTMFLNSAALNFNVWSPYVYYLDADNAGDGAIVTLIIQ